MALPWSWRRSASGRGVAAGGGLAVILCRICRFVDFSGLVPVYTCGLKCAGSARECRAFEREAGADDA